MGKSNHGRHSRLPGRGRAAVARILVVEGNSGVAERLKKLLGRAGWKTSSAASAAQARLVVFNDAIGLVVVRIALPDGDGRELCREIRAADGPPVILIGGPAQKPELIAGLELGADDAIVEPFANAELLARVAAVLRRTSRKPFTPTPRRRMGPLAIDPAMRSVTLNDEPVRLTPREYALLLALVERPGEVMTRDELLSAVWGPGWMGTDKVLDVQISGLRRKLGDHPDRPRLIHTVRGAGFLLAPADDE